MNPATLDTLRYTKTPDGSVFRIDGLVHAEGTFCMRLDLVTFVAADQAKILVPLTEFTAGSYQPATDDDAGKAYNQTAAAVGMKLD